MSALAHRAAMLRLADSEPTPMAKLSYRGISATTQAARRLKGTARPHARPGDEPSLVRHGMSVA